MEIDYKIMGIPQRMDNIEVLKKQLDLTSDDVFLDTECRKNPMWTWKQTARVKADDDITHRVIIQDDAILCDDFKQFCEYLVKRFPDAIWMLYNHKDLTNGIPKYVVFRPGCCMGGVASIIPIKYINDIIKLHEDKHSDFTNDDKFIHYWANNNNVDVFSTFPSVIGTIPCESSLGHNYDYEYPRCKEPLKHKWANATLFRYFNYKWNKLESIWNKEYYKKVFEKERNNVWRQVVNISEDLCAVITSKNACTTLCNLCADFYNEPVAHKGDCYRIAVKHNITDVKNKILFSVYRDPVERFLSFYADKVLGEEKCAFIKSLDTINNIDEMLDIVEHELQKDPHDIDQHIRRQVDTYPLERINIIVPIEQLDAFLRQYDIHLQKHYNVGNKQKPVLNKEQEERIRLLYKDDYEILKSDKIWKNTQSAQ